MSKYINSLHLRAKNEDGKKGLRCVQRGSSSLRFRGRRPTVARRPHGKFHIATFIAVVVSSRALSLSRRYRGTSRRVTIYRAIGGVSVTHSSSSRADNRSLCARCSAALSSSPCLAKILRTMRQSHCFHIASTLQCGVVTYVNLICRSAHRLGIIR